MLPFRNLTGDTTQAHVADGLTEDIITTLSQVPRLFVIARRSSFAFKGKPTPVRTVAEKLGVRFVLEGGVQRTKDRMRVNVQLVDAVRGRLIWAHRYDRAATDLFKVKDEIILRIATELLVKLTEGEQARIGLSITRNLAAWEALRQGTVHLRKYSKGSNARARPLYLEAISLDPNAVQAWSAVGWTHWFDARFGWSDSRSKSLETAIAMAHRALKGDPSHGDAYRLLGSSHLLRREYDKALAFHRKSVAREPNGAQAAAVYAFVLNYAARPAEAIVQMQRAMRLSPYYPAWYLSHLGLSYHLAGQHDKALAAQTAATRRMARNALFRARLAALYADLGRMSEARAMAAEVRRLSPRHTIRYHMAANPFKDAAVRDRWMSLLRKAGLHE